MELKEKISITEVYGQVFRIREVEAFENEQAAFTHYMHNHKNGAAKFL